MHANICFVEHYQYEFQAIDFIDFTLAELHFCKCFENGFSIFAAKSDIS